MIFITLVPRVYWDAVYLDLERWGRISRPSLATKPSVSFQESRSADGSAVFMATSNSSVQSGTLQQSQCFRHCWRAGRFEWSWSQKLRLYKSLTRQYCKIIVNASLWLCTTIDVFALTQKPSTPNFLTSDLPADLATWRGCPGRPCASRWRPCGSPRSAGGGCPPGTAWAASPDGDYCRRHPPHTRSRLVNKIFQKFSSLEWQNPTALP